MREDAKFTLMGQNGAGKSTMFKLITGEFKPDKGKIHFPPTATTATAKQVMAREHLSETVLEYFSHVFDEGSFAFWLYGHFWFTYGTFLQQ